MLSTSEADTIRIAATLTAELLPKLRARPVIISLQGDLGTGKTQFVKGIAQTLGVKPEVVSPSFVYMRNYPFDAEWGRGELVHVDAWRMKQESDFKLLGVDTYLKPGHLLAIEWPQKYAESLVEGLQSSGREYTLVEVRISEVGEDRREIEILHVHG